MNTKKEIIMKMTDIYYPKTWFLSLTSMTKLEFDEMNLMETQDGYPLFAAIEYWKNKTKLATSINLEDDIDIEALKKKNQKQKLVLNHLQIMNKIGIFVPKSIAELRMKKLLKTVAEHIKSGIARTAPKLLNRDDVREIIEEMTNGYRLAIQELTTTCDLISWADEGSAEQIERKLFKLASKDSDVREILDDVLGEDYSEDTEEDY